MKILILGARGMLGHKLLYMLSQKFSVTGTVRGNASQLKNLPPFSGLEIISGINAENFHSIQNLLDERSFDIAINCIGIVKQLPEAQDPIKTITINSLFPHQLARLCQERNIRLIHYSTDCVFSGEIGEYSESDKPDAEDLYGRSKMLGEVTGNGCLTIRTSLIGREISGFHSLFEWLLQQNGRDVHGFTKAIFSGLSTNAHAEIIEAIILKYPNLNGLYHVASAPISKYELLKKFIEKFDLNITIIPDDSIVCDRSLNGKQFIHKTSLTIPSWDEMIEQMYKEKALINN